MAGCAGFIQIICLCIVLVSTKDVPEASYPVGDPRSCLSLKGTRIERFEVLPGCGWDNLRNVDAGLIVSYNFSQCKTTEDGRFLIPDSVNTIPLKTSKVETFAELVDHWTNYTSTTSHSVNVDVGVSFDSAKVSGKFSADFENVKSSQIGDHSYTTRVQLRYVRYTAKLQPDAPLNSAFKNRVLSIAAHIELNRTEQARYESQLLVRDFGTHVITSVNAGAALVQEDQVKSEFVKKYQSSKNQVTAAASASLFGILNFGASYTYQTTKAFVDQYRAARTHSEISTYGGPLFKAGNFTANDWSSDVDRDLVAVDRSGDPIYFFITAATLPELPSSTLYEVYNVVADAVKIYYDYNTYRGCTQMDSPNFSPIANLDDGTCHSPLSNLTFGGIFQTCKMTPGSNGGDLCKDLDQVNPKTGQHSCPESYEEVLLHAGPLATGHSEHHCHRCWLFFKCCHDDYYHSSAIYKSYWCAAKGPVPQDSGYLFGGVFTSQVNNPLTQSKTCPINFYSRLLGTDLHVCISDDYELGYKYSMPFGGFISCNAGNPLALDSAPKRPRNLKGGRDFSLHAFFSASAASHWPKHCPKGFSQHLAFVDQGCEINYCLKTGSLTGPGLPPVRRPPYMKSPMMAPNVDNYVMFDPETKEWKKNQIAMQYIKSQGGNKPNFVNESGSGLSPGSAAGVSVAATLGCIGLATVAVLIYRRRGSRSKREYRKMDDPPLLSRQSNYGSNESEDVTVEVHT